MLHELQERQRTPDPGSTAIPEGVPQASVPAPCPELEPGLPTKPPVPASAPPPIPTGPPPPVSADSPPPIPTLSTRPSTNGGASLGGATAAAARGIPSAGLRRGGGEQGAGGGGGVLARWQQATEAENARKEDEKEARRVALEAEMQMVREQRAKVDGLRKTLQSKRQGIVRKRADSSVVVAATATTTTTTQALSPTTVERTRAAEVEAEVARRRAGLFEDIEDEDELLAKEMLVEKVDKWLADDVGMGGTGRGFDPTALIQYAWRLQLETLSCDEIYGAFVENQQEEMKRRMASQLGLEALGLSTLAQTAAMELDSVCAKCGWLAVEEAGKIRKAFVNRWVLLWRDPQKADFEQVLLFYEGEDADTPLGMLQLTVGAFSVAPPKITRKGFPHAFRIESHAAGATGSSKTILAAETAAEYSSWCTALAMQLGGGGGHAAATTTGQGGGGGASGGVISRKEAKQLALLRQNEAKMQLTALSPKFASAGMQATLEAVGVGTQDQPTWVQHHITGLLKEGWVRKHRGTGLGGTHSLSAVAGGLGSRLGANNKDVDFERRWAILWRHPSPADVDRAAEVGGFSSHSPWAAADAPINYALLLYTELSSDRPESCFILTHGHTSATPVDHATASKGSQQHPHYFHLQQQPLGSSGSSLSSPRAKLASPRRMSVHAGSSGGTGSGAIDFLFSVDNEEELKEWIGLLRFEKEFEKLAVDEQHADGSGGTVLDAPSGPFETKLALALSSPEASPRAAAVDRLSSTSNSDSSAASSNVANSGGSSGGGLRGKVGKFGRRMSVSMTTMSSPRSSAAAGSGAVALNEAVDTASVAKQGYLLKRGAKNTAFKRRWFSLDTHCYM